MQKYKKYDSIEISMGFCTVKAFSTKAKQRKYE